MFVIMTHSTFSPKPKKINCRVSSEKMVVKRDERIKVSSTPAMQRILQVRLPAWKRFFRENMFEAIYNNTFQLKKLLFLLRSLHTGHALLQVIPSAWK